MLGFATLHDAIPGHVGTCLDDEHHNPENGDGLQDTSGGLLVWRKADNWTAFTDGYRTWVNGPQGLQERLNTQRFAWEADYFVDQRFAVVLFMPPEDAAPALATLHTQWFIGNAGPALDASPYHVQNIDPRDLQALATSARQLPGRTWSLSLEPNGFSASQGIAEADPARYATVLHDVSTVLKSADPTAQLIGPDVLNWSFGCLGCGGMRLGRDWTDAMRAAYLKHYGEEPPFDIWTVHTYPLDWEHLPTVNYQLMEQQLVDLRSYLDSIPALRGKPIWDTELGAHWGYTAYQFQNVNGRSVIMPAGVARPDLVQDYFQHMLTWLTSNGARYNITRWFVFAAYNPDVPGDRAGSISLLNAAGPDPQLTAFGRIYLAAAASRQVAIHP